MASLAAAHHQPRQADGKFGPQTHPEAPAVVLAGPRPSTVGTCSRCQETGEGFQAESGLCEDCHDEYICRECGTRNDLDGDGYDGLCASCADKEYEEEEE